MLTLWESRHDLRNVFPDIWNRDRVSFCQWFVDSAQREYGFTQDYIEPVRGSLELATGVNKVEEESQQTNLKPIEWKVKAYRKLYNVSLKLKPLIIKVVPDSRKSQLKQLKEKIQRKAYTGQVESSLFNVNTLVSVTSESAVNEKGINLIGYARSETGVGESCRLAANAYTAADISFGIINFNLGNIARSQDMTWASKEIERPLYNVNIFHVNADQMPIACEHLGQNIVSGRYNIGYWHWELPEFPDEWNSSFQLVHEIWVPSQFIVDAISTKSPVPVIKIPHGIEVKLSGYFDRNHFGLPDKPFLFMSMFDTYSFQERKNPIAVVHAFKKAFQPNDEKVGLVIKVNHSNGNPEGINMLKRVIEGYQNIYLIEGTLNRDEINALITNTDCFVSLHRSEGFGLGLAEAMYLGKPVIGTNWSANIDFMNQKNSCTVDYKLIQLGSDMGPYKAHQYWADPDLDHASYYMKKLYSDREYYERIAVEGQKTIHNEFSPKVVGEKVKNRLKNIGLL
ncbi:glycosyltransferase [Paenibacillus sp. MSJ-34]|nr:glycosyltransferase [Paenibacillus sp. MSJ-34]